MWKAIKGGIFLGLALACIYGCRESDSTGPIAPDPVVASLWDTSFTIGGVRFPDSLTLARSVINLGDTYRLSRFFEKCESGGPVKIGFIGGSITAGAGASVWSRRYSSLLASFLQRAFPRAEFSELNAGIGGTGSRFGASRMQEDLVRDSPDLIVLEFAVNDDFGDSLNTQKTFEGLIRHGLENQDVPVLVFQMRGQSLDTVNQSIQNALARWYHLPVVSYLEATRSHFASGEWQWSTLGADDIHPNDSGHLLAGYLLYHFLKAARETMPGGASPFAVPDPLHSALFAHADILHQGDSSVAVTAGQWTSMVNVLWQETRPTGRVGFLSDHAGDTVSFETSAREVTLVFSSLNSAADARVQVSLDGNVQDTVVRSGASQFTAQVYSRADSTRHRIRVRNLGNAHCELSYVLYAL